MLQPLPSNPLPPPPPTPPPPRVPEILLPTVPAGAVNPAVATIIHTGAFDVAAAVDSAAPPLPQPQPSAVVASCQAPRSCHCLVLPAPVAPPSFRRHLRGHRRQRASAAAIDPAVAAVALAPAIIIHTPAAAVFVSTIVPAASSTVQTAASSAI